MTDHEAMDAINAVLDEWFRGGLNPNLALQQIARISGMNKTSHEEAE